MRGKVGATIFKQYRKTDQKLTSILPEEVVTAPSIDSFKERLDKLWKKKQPLYYSHKATITGVLSKGVTHPCEEERS